AAQRPDPRDRRHRHRYRADWPGRGQRGQRCAGHAGPGGVTRWTTHDRSCARRRLPCPRQHSTARTSGSACGIGAMIRVVVADDQPLIRMGLRTLIDAEGDIELVGEATDGAEALTVVRETVPDVVLMDIRMPGNDGLAALIDITGDPALASVRVVMLTTFE